MNMILQLLFLVVGFVMLSKGSDWFVDGACDISRRFHIPQLIVGLTIVAMGTSAPEAAVSITSAFKGVADITIGNIVGSNILNILVILGLASAIVPLSIANSTIRVDMPFLIVITAVLYVMGLDGTISFLDGLILAVCFILYIAYLIYCAKFTPEGAGEEEPAKELKLWQALLALVGGLAVIVLGSNIAVNAATEIARIIGISERIIGLTIVALGTSLPELFHHRRQKGQCRHCHRQHRRFQHLQHSLRRGPVRADHSRAFLRCIPCRHAYRPGRRRVPVGGEPAQAQARPHCRHPDARRLPGLPAVHYLIFQPLSIRTGVFHLSI